ncbi:MAG: PEP-CTERM sorting domain-containing protein [bacterium]|nr:PEP-CTERM sorting domain-containing protein [bacterium]
MKQTFALSAVFFCALTHQQVAHATPVTIDFSSGAYSTVPPGSNNVYMESGFTFSTPPGTNTHFDSGTGGLCCPTVLVFHESANNFANNRITLDFGGAAFDILSFDLVLDPAILAFNPVINPIMDIMASDGRTAASPFATGQGFQGTVNLNWGNITSVTFDIRTNSTAVGNVLMDNVRLDDDPSGAAVPEPTTFALVALGLVAVAFNRRRQTGRDTA